MKDHEIEIRTKSTVHFSHGETVKLTSLLREETIRNVCDRYTTRARRPIVRGSKFAKQMLKTRRRQTSLLLAAHFTHFSSGIINNIERSAASDEKRDRTLHTPRV